jgi:hypothetical protein
MQELCFNCDFDEELQPIREPASVGWVGVSRKPTLHH